MRCSSSLSRNFFLSFVSVFSSFCLSGSFSKLPYLSNRYPKHLYRGRNSIRKSIQFASSPVDFSAKLSSTENLPVPYQIDEEAEPAARQPGVGRLHRQLVRRMGMQLNLQLQEWFLPSSRFSFSVLPDHLNQYSSVIHSDTF